jgi:excisionase family DNA binding protein
MATVSERSLPNTDISISPSIFVPLAYSIADAVKATGIGRTTLYSLIKHGDLPTVKIGARTLIRHVDLQGLVNRHLT